MLAVLMAYAKVHKVQANDIGQRIDNFLISKNRTVPKSRYYRAIRSGEVRVNKKRVAASYRIKAEDQVRIPPFVADADGKNSQLMSLHDNQRERLDEIICYESEDYILVNKPPGIAVHSGSGVQNGLVDQLMALKSIPLYLVHRLDKDVSGCLLLAKNRQALNVMIEQWSTGVVKKIYHAMVFCNTEPRHRIIGSSLSTASGRQQTAETELTSIKMYNHHACVKLRITTGRKHQIRRHLAAEGIPIIGDQKYGDFSLNKGVLMKGGLQHLYLIAKQLVIPIRGQSMVFEVEYPDWWVGSEINTTCS